MYIDGPDVVTTGNVGSYIVFGEVKFLDFTNKANAALDSVKKATAAKDDKPKETIQEEADEEEPEKENEFPEESIKTIMDYGSCTRTKAISVLRKTKGDVVEAITQASS